MPMPVAGIKGDLEVMNSRSSEEHQPTFWGGLLDAKALGKLYFFFEVSVPRRKCSVALRKGCVWLLW